MSAGSKPNIVLIFTDNQQASKLGCYDNPEIHTPNLDRLASQGMIFDNAFCPNAFCSPCRASLLTGLLPSQHGVHSWIDDRNMADWPENWHALDGLWGCVAGRERCSTPLLFVEHSSCSTNLMLVEQNGIRDVYTSLLHGTCRLSRPAEVVER